MSNPPQRYELRITASGTVRDADGNIVEQDVPMETTQVLTEDEIKQLINPPSED